MAEKQTMLQQETALEMERDRCLSLPLAQLGSERLTSGKFNGKEVREAFEDKKYMVWMATHQRDNLKFVNLLMYAQRQAEIEMAGKSSSAISNVRQSKRGGVDRSDGSTDHARGSRAVQGQDGHRDQDDPVSSGAGDPTAKRRASSSIKCCTKPCSSSTSRRKPSTS